MNILRSRNKLSSTIFSKPRTHGDGVWFKQESNQQEIYKE